jgi:hypothetical protein
MSWPRVAQLAMLLEGIDRREPERFWPAEKRSKIAPNRAKLLLRISRFE